MEAVHDKRAKAIRAPHTQHERRSEAPKRVDTMERHLPPQQRYYQHEHGVHGAVAALPRRDHLHAVGQAGAAFRQALPSPRRTPREVEVEQPRPVEASQRYQIPVTQRAQRAGRTICSCAVLDHCSKQATIHQGPCKFCSGPPEIVRYYPTDIGWHRLRETAKRFRAIAGLKDFEEQSRVPRIPGNQTIAAEGVRLTLEEHEFSWYRRAVEEVGPDGVPKLSEALSQSRNF